MKVFVDARWTRTDHHDGISRYGAGLIAALHHLHPVTMLIHDEDQLRLLPRGVPYVLINNPMSPRELWVSRTLDRLGADVVFSPMQVIGGFRRRYALILTLHDLIYYRHPQPPGFLPAAVRLVWRLYHRAFWPQRVLLNRADRVVTVSETTKRLIAHHRLTRRPVTVVYNAPQPDGDDETGARAAGSGRAETDSTGASGDLVYMGSFMPYKNVETMIDAMADLPGHTLHLLSRIDPAREAELRARVPAGATVVFWRGVDDEDYRRLLSRAQALVTASRDEGFGLPIIEAMNSSTPVICSDLEIFREVTGGNALFFDPDSPSAFVAAVRRLGADQDLRSELVTAARTQASGFTWHASACRLLDVMRACVPDEPADTASR